MESLDDFMLAFRANPGDFQFIANDGGETTLARVDTESGRILSEFPQSLVNSYVYPDNFAVRAPLGEGDAAAFIDRDPRYTLSQLRELWRTSALPRNGISFERYMKETGAVVDGDRVTQTTPKDWGFGDEGGFLADIKDIASKAGMMYGAFVGLGAAFQSFSASSFGFASESSILGASETAAGAVSDASIIGASESAAVAVSDASFSVVSETAVGAVADVNIVGAESMFDYVDDIFETASGVETDFTGWDTDIFSGGTTDPTYYADDGQVFFDQVESLPETPLDPPDPGQYVDDAQPQTGVAADSNPYDLSYGSNDIVEGDFPAAKPDGNVPGTQTLDNGNVGDVVKRAYQVGKTVMGGAPAKAKGVISPTVRTEAGKTGAATTPLPSGVETPKLADIFGRIAEYGKAAQQGARVVQDFKTKVTQADARAKQTIAIKNGTVAAGLRDDQKSILLVGAVAAAAFLL